MYDNSYCFQLIIIPTIPSWPWAWCSGCDRRLHSWPGVHARNYRDQLSHQDLWRLAHGPHHQDGPAQADPLPHDRPLPEWRGLLRVRNLPHDREHGWHPVPQLPREPALLLPPASRGDVPGGGGDPGAGHGTHPGGGDGGGVPGNSNILCCQ